MRLKLKEFRAPKGMGIISDFAERVRNDPNARKRTPLHRANAICFRRDLTTLAQEQGRQDWKNLFLQGHFISLNL